MSFTRPWSRLARGRGRWLIVGAAALAAAFALPVRGQDTSSLARRQFTARVVSVIDGDTVDLSMASGRTQRTRLHGVDTPESGEPFSNVARNYLRTLVFAKDVSVTGKDVDRYGRLVARLFVDGRDVSEAMIAAGLACTYHTYAREAVLDAAVNRARAGGLGFWAAGADRPRCVAREAGTASAARPSSSTARPSTSKASPPPPSTVARTAGFVGNVSSRVYHLPTCRNATCPNCTRAFATAAEAQAAGFRPAADCIR